MFVSCSLFVVRCLWFDVRCGLLVAVGCRCRLVIEVRCLVMFAVAAVVCCLLLFVGVALLCVIWRCCLLRVGRWLLFVVCCL